jgi:hypothetical protein
VTVGCEDVQFTPGVEVLHVPALKIESGFLAGFEKLNAISDRPSHHSSPATKIKIGCTARVDNPYNDHSST